MFAIVKVGGRQYRVQSGTELVVDRVSASEGEEITLPSLLVSDEDDVRLGEGTVTATVVEHLRGPKITIQKHKPKRGYKRRMGFRAAQTRLTIGGIAKD